MSSTGTLSQSRLAMISHISLRVASLVSIHRCASWTAISSALAAFGFLSTQSARMPKLFSGWFFHSSPVTSAL